MTVMFMKISHNCKYSYSLNNVHVCRGILSCSIYYSDSDGIVNAPPYQLLCM